MHIILISILALFMVSCQYLPTLIKEAEEVEEIIEAIEKTEGEA